VRRVMQRVVEVEQPDQLTRHVPPRYALNLGIWQQLDKQRSVGADHRAERLLGEHFQQQ
jgi:hypothetical protein